MVMFKACHKATHRSGYMSPITSRPFSSKPKIWELRLKVLIQKDIWGFVISINYLCNWDRKGLKPSNWIRGCLNMYQNIQCEAKNITITTHKTNTLRKRNYKNMDAENEFCHPWWVVTIIISWSVEIDLSSSANVFSRNYEVCLTSQ